MTEDPRPSLMIDGIPEQVAAGEAAILRSRLLRDVEAARTAANLDDINIWVGTNPKSASMARISENSNVKTGQARASDDITVEQRAVRYTAQEPLWGMEYLIVPQEVKDELLLAIETIKLEPLVFDTWGLRAIEPFPRSALNLHGAPGTGKTLAAHGVAAELRTKILVASYAQIESMYHGEGPKNVEALFHAAERDGAVLFIDEADSLLSRRLTNVTQGSEQAINSMRSQLLICLEKYRGVVIFATNLVTNYDPAFETRVRHIHFPMPDAEAREAIWSKHLPETLPLHPDVDMLILARAEEVFCGRDIKNAVVNAALQTARKGGDCLCQQDFLEAIRRIVEAREALRPTTISASLTEDVQGRIRNAVQAADSETEDGTLSQPK